MKFILAFTCTIILLKLIFNFFNKKPKEKTWANKPFNEELSYEEKRLLILRVNKPREKVNGYGWERNDKDIMFYNILDRFTLSLAFSSIRQGESIQMSGEQVSATPEVVKSSAKSAQALYSQVKEEYKIDLMKLAQKDFEGADLSKDPLL